MARDIAETAHTAMDGRRVRTARTGSLIRDKVCSDRLSWSHICLNTVVRPIASGIGAKSTERRGLFLTTPNLESVLIIRFGEMACETTYNADTRIWSGNAEDFDTTQPIGVVLLENLKARGDKVMQVRWWQRTDTHNTLFASSDLRRHNGIDDRCGAL